MPDDDDEEEEEEDEERRKMREEEDGIGRSKTTVTQHPVQHPMSQITLNLQTIPQLCRPLPLAGVKKQFPTPRQALLHETLLLYSTLRQTKHP